MDTGEEEGDAKDNSAFIDMFGKRGKRQHKSGKSKVVSDQQINWLLFFCMLTANSCIEKLPCEMVFVFVFSSISLPYTE